MSLRGTGWRPKAPSRQRFLIQAIRVGPHQRASGPVIVERPAKKQTLMVPGILSQAGVSNERRNESNAGSNDVNKQRIQQAVSEYA